MNGLQISFLYELKKKVMIIDEFSIVLTSQSSSDASKGTDSDGNVDLSKETKDILDGEKQGKLPKSGETGLSQAEINRRQVESNAIATGHAENQQRLAEARRLDSKREAGDFR